MSGERKRGIASIILPSLALLAIFAYFLAHQWQSGRDAGRLAGLAQRAAQIDEIAHEIYEARHAALAVLLGVPPPAPADVGAWRGRLRAVAVPEDAPAERIRGTWAQADARLADLQEGPAFTAAADPLARFRAYERAVDAVLAVAARLTVQSAVPAFDLRLWRGHLLQRIEAAAAAQRDLLMLATLLAEGPDTLSSDYARAVAVQKVLIERYGVLAGSAGADVPDVVGGEALPADLGAVRRRSGGEGAWALDGALDAAEARIAALHGLESDVWGTVAAEAMAARGQARLVFAVLLLLSLAILAHIVRLALHNLRRAERTEQVLSEAVADLPVALAICDADGHIALSNQRFAALFPDEAAKGAFSGVEEGGQLAALLRRRPRFSSAIDAPVAMGGHWLLINRKQLAGGQSIYLFTDVTELRSTEARLQDAVMAAEEANRAKRDFLANVGHELRTPLNAVIGFADLIDGEIFGPLEPPQYKEYATLISRSAKDLLAKVNGILEFVRLSSGTAALDLQSVDLGEMVAELGEAAAKDAGHKDIVLESAAPENLVVLADPWVLRESLVRLLDNAVKFTDPGGVIRLQAEAGAPGTARLVVADTGIGIAEADVEKAFAPFGQSDSGLERRFEGLGMGLPMARRLVEMLGGTLTLSSQPGQGTTVRVTLPLDGPQVDVSPQLREGLPEDPPVVPESDRRPKQVMNAR